LLFWPKTTLTWNALKSIGASADNTWTSSSINTEVLPVQAWIYNFMVRVSTLPGTSINQAP
jgi:hypothetical protein